MAFSHLQKGEQWNGTEGFSLSGEHVCAHSRLAFGKSYVKTKSQSWRRPLGGKLCSDIPTGLLELDAQIEFCFFFENIFYQIFTTQIQQDSLTVLPAVSGKGKKTNTERVFATVSRAVQRRLGPDQPQSAVTTTAFTIGVYIVNGNISCRLQ